MILKKKLWKQLTVIIVVCALVVGTTGTNVAFAANNQKDNVTATIANLSENVDGKATNEGSIIENIKPEERTPELDKILKECKEIETDDKSSKEIKRGQMVSVQSVLENYNTMIAILSNGDLYCWGDNEYGQVGNGTIENQLIPYKVLFKNSSNDKEESNTKFTLDDSVSGTLGETTKISGLVY